MGIAYGAYPEPGERLTRAGLTVKKLERGFPYLLGAGPKNAGRLQIYHTLLPEYCGKAFFTGKPKYWKKEIAGRLLVQAKERAMDQWDCREQLWAPELGEKGDEIPPELWAACLYRCRPFDRIFVSLEEEEGEYGLRRLLSLLLPYLPRMRQVTWVGEESGVFLALESWLYGEFGIITGRAEKAPPGEVWLDLKGHGEEGCQVSRAQDGAVWEPRQRSVRSKGTGHINCRETLKFLDTAVKNGYNTKAN